MNWVLIIKQGFAQKATKTNNRLYDAMKTTAQECDARGDAIEFHSLVHKKFNCLIRNNFNIFVVSKETVFPFLNVSC